MAYLQTISEGWIFKERKTCTIVHNYNGNTNLIVVMNGFQTIKVRRFLSWRHRGGFWSCRHRLRLILVFHLELSAYIFWVKAQNEDLLLYWWDFIWYYDNGNGLNYSITVDKYALLRFVEISGKTSVIPVDILAQSR